MRRSTNKQLLLMDVNPQSPLSEAYRVLRTNLEFASREQNMKAIAVTSAEQGEGKTTTIANLAVAFAQIGKKVLLIDADLHRPNLHDIFHKHARGGLTQLLARQYNLKQLVQETHIDNLFLLPAGPLPVNASELLASASLGEVLEEAKAGYDYILVDTPPALAVSDAQVTASQCDGVLLVAKAGKVKRQSVVQAKTALERVQANFLGVVLNHAKRKREKRPVRAYSENPTEAAALK